MATSGTDSYAPNKAQLVQDALEMCGITDADPDVVSSATRSLNSLIKALNFNKTDVNVIVRTELETVAGQESYSITALGIDGAYVSVSADDYPLQPITSAQYNAKTNKQSSGRPHEFYHDKQAGKLYLYPSPDSAYTVTYGRVRQYQDMTDDEQTFDLPSSAMEMLTFGLAHRYGFKIGLDAGSLQLLQQQFEQAKANYMVANTAYTKGQIAPTCMVV